MSAANRQYAFRLPAVLVERIDRYAVRRARIDARPCTRSEALRLLIEKGLTLEMPATKAESISGLVTDSFEPAPASKKKQRPHRRQDRVPGAAKRDKSAVLWKKQRPVPTLSMLRVGR